MTELIDYLNKALQDGCDVVKVSVDYIPTIVEALEKQIPKKPNDYNDGFLYCESCGHPTLNKDKSEPYCFICGQAIDWSDNK